MPELSIEGILRTVLRERRRGQHGRAPQGGIWGNGLRAQHAL